MKKLEIGDKAPDFAGVDQEGNVVTSGQFRGRKLVVYFYPKDDTPGCTAEACNIRDNYRVFLDRGYSVIGVSADSRKSHLKFISRYNLPFPLISDPDRKIIGAFGAWGEKKMFGRVFMGILRMTFVISEDGLVEKIIDQVKTEDHSRQILEREKHT